MKYAHELEETKHKDLYFDILNQNILNMGGRGKDNFQNISAKQQDEIFFYKIHHTALGIMEVSHVDEVQSYETQTQNWIETYLR